MVAKNPVHCVGEKFTIEWALDGNGTARGLEYFQQLRTKDQVKVTALLKRLADHGAITNREKFKKLDDGLFEFKSYQVRLLGDFRPGGRFLIAYGVTKKDDRHKNKDLRIAREILANH